MAPSWPMSVQLGEMTLRTISATSSNSSPSSSQTPKPSQTCLRRGFASASRRSNQQPDRCLGRAVRDNQDRYSFDGQRNFQGDFPEDLLHWFPSSALKADYQTAAIDW